MDVETEFIHLHCLNCIVLSKCVAVPKPGISCEIIKCEFNCGAKFHLCKKEEHVLLCPNVKVPCINAEYGCSLLLLRRRQANHLYSCPASVIYCSAEWNRFPIHIYAKNIFQKAAFQKTKHYDLDIALAMRDRRMLDAWCDKAGRGSESSLAKFKMSPHISWIVKHEQSYENNKKSEMAPPGLKQSVCNELCRNSISLSSISNHDQSNGEEQSPENRSVEASCSCAENADSPSGSDNEENACNNCLHSENSVEPKLTSNYTLKDVLIISDYCIKYIYSEIFIKKNDSLFSKSNSEEANFADNARELPLDPVTQLPYLKFKNPSSTPPWCVPLGLDLNIESKTLQHSSMFMYTFLCSQEFRRDEYAEHYKNVHCEIHSGLNGWLQERCPLAQYGCQFSRKRFNPAPGKSIIVHNEVLDSFGVTSAEPVHGNENIQNTRNGFHNRSNEILNDCLKPPKNNELKLTDLPIEVLQYLISFLDSFSLSNLSLTCSSLRLVCASHLEQQGLVVLKWIKEIGESGCTWRVDGKKWFYSAHFTSINQWHFDERNNMSNHLKSCPFFHRAHHRYPPWIIQNSRNSEGLCQYNFSVCADEDAKDAPQQSNTKL